VQQCGVRNTHIALLDPSILCSRLLHSFAEWLHKHAPLVNSITAMAAGAIGGQGVPTYGSPAAAAKSPAGYSSTGRCRHSRSSRCCCSSCNSCNSSASKQ
jgi:hypothetical protein